MPQVEHYEQPHNQVSVQTTHKTTGVLCKTASSSVTQTLDNLCDPLGGLVKSHIAQPQHPWSELTTSFSTCACLAERTTAACTGLPPEYRSLSRRQHLEVRHHAKISQPVRVFNSRNNTQRHRCTQRRSLSQERAISPAKEPAL